MKISLVHPTRQRIERAEGAVAEWAAMRSGDHEIEHILSVDTDDPQVEAYRALAARLHLRIVVHPNRTMIQAANTGAQHATGELLVVVSDDFGCPEQWDRTLAAIVQGRPLAAVQVGDAISSRIMTLPVLTRDYYRQLGYVYYPGYRSMFADDDLTAVAERDGVWIDARHVVFPHRHYSVKLSGEDATYSRQNSLDAWWFGWSLFQQRRISQFGVLTGWRVALAQWRVRVYYWFRTQGAAVRRRWGSRLPPWMARLERSVGSAVLGVAGRLTSVNVPH